MAFPFVVVHKMAARREGKGAFGKTADELKKEHEVTTRLEAEYFSGQKGKKKKK